MDWEVTVTYKRKNYLLAAEKIYESAQVMRIKVYGRKGFIVLENDYPFLISKGSKRALKWKLKEEGFLDMKTEEDCQLVANIISSLEYLLKDKDADFRSRMNHLKRKP